VPGAGNVPNSTPVTTDTPSVNTYTHASMGSANPRGEAADKRRQHADRARKG
jgi:hypothetical protein